MQRGLLELSPSRAPEHPQTFCQDRTVKCTLFSSSSKHLFLSNISHLYQKRGLSQVLLYNLPSLAVPHSLTEHKTARKALGLLDPCLTNGPHAFLSIQTGRIELRDSCSSVLLLSNWNRAASLLCTLLKRLITPNVLLGAPTFLFHGQFNPFSG
jgi:hypothetical protein